LTDLFKSYEELALVADEAFKKIQSEFKDQVKCQRYCTDCCYAIFGLFPIEAAYLKCHFEKLALDVRREALRRSREAEEEMRRIQEKLSLFEDGTELKSYAVARERVRCPLLSEAGDCILYPRRPLTCRLYGIPVAIHGRGQVCWKAGFAKGKKYPTFNLDLLHRKLYRLSVILLKRVGVEDLEIAALLFSVPKVLQTSFNDLVRTKHLG